MKKNDLIDVKKMEAKDLGKKLEKMQSELSDLIIEKNTGKLADLKAVNKKRRDIAQMITVFNQKQLLAGMEKQNG